MTKCSSDGDVVKVFNFSNRKNLMDKFHDDINFTYVDIKINYFSNLIFKTLSLLSLCHTITEYQSIAVSAIWCHPLILHLTIISFFCLTSTCLSNEHAPRRGRTNPGRHQIKVSDSRIEKDVLFWRVKPSGLFPGKLYHIQGRGLGNLEILNQISCLSRATLMPIIYTQINDTGMSFVSMTRRENVVSVMTWGQSDNCERKTRTM